MGKLCLSTKLPHQEIRWNYDIFRSGHCELQTKSNMELKVPRINVMLQIFFLATIPLVHMVSTKRVFIQCMHVLLQGVPSRHLLNLLHVTTENTRAMHNICSKLTIKTSKRHHVVFLFNVLSTCRLGIHLSWASKG